MVKLAETTDEGDEQTGEELIVVQNWVEELLERVPLEP